MNPDILPARKLKFGRHWRPTHHRSGWGYAMDALDCLHCGDGVFLDGFIEKKFAWGCEPGDKWNGLAPYTEPWIGFVHNPPGVPEWFNTSHQRPDDILRMPCWAQSVNCCQGLFTLSASLAEWLKQRVPVPVCSLPIPAETPVNRFDAKKYMANAGKQIVQVGWWLRRFRSIYELRTPKLKKVLLTLPEPWTEAVHRIELGFIRDPALLRSVQLVPYLPNDEYDELLSKNIVFLDLYDSSANNAIAECIVRATPVLVNPLPAVVEYLGSDYPFYFRTLDEAAGKAENEALVLAAHQYLEASPIRKRLAKKHFLQSFAESGIYRSLPVPPSAAGRTIVVEVRDCEHDAHAYRPAPGAVGDSREEPLVGELRQEWNRSLGGDGQARAHWQVVEGGHWSWQTDAVCARSSGSEWSAYQYSRADPQALRALKNFVVEVIVSGSAVAAGLSFGPYKDFLVELQPQTGRHRLQLEVNTSADTWAFRVDGRLAERSWWDSAVRNTADLADGTLTFKARRAECVLFQDLCFHTFPGTCELSLIVTCNRLAQHLRVCLRNWLHQSLGPDAYEILVVNSDGPGSIHELLDAVVGSYPHVRVREVSASSMPAVNREALMNRALELSRGQWICLTDSDCLFSPTCAATVLGQIAGRTDRMYYGQRRPLSGAQTAALVSGRLDGLFRFDLLAGGIPPRQPDNSPMGYTQIVHRTALERMWLRGALADFSGNGKSFVENCVRHGIVPEEVPGFFCLRLEHPS